MDRLALGTAQFGLNYGIANQAGQVSRLEVKSILQFALANGIDILDTAVAYGNSEARLGQVGTQGFKLVTKLPAIPDGCKDVGGWVGQEVKKSFSRLGVKSVYGLLLHRPEQLLGKNGIELFRALQALKDCGQVLKIGISIYSPDELDALTQFFHFDLVQAPFNLIDRRLYTSGWMERLKDGGVEIHSRSTFLQGLLLMKQSEIPLKFLYWDSLWQKWYRWLDDYAGSALQACLTFSLSFPGIDRVLIGADSQNQLMQIVSAINSRLSMNFPDVSCDDENLIIPSNWGCL